MNSLTLAVISSSVPVLSCSPNSVYHFRCGHARARLGGAILLDLLGPSGRCSGCWPHDGEVAGGAVAIFALAELLFAISVRCDDGSSSGRATRC